jgi:hypothetical protein
MWKPEAKCWNRLLLRLRPCGEPRGCAQVGHQSGRTSRLGGIDETFRRATAWAQVQLARAAPGGSQEAAGDQGPIAREGPQRARKIVDLPIWKRITLDTFKSVNAIRAALETEHLHVGNSGDEIVDYRGDPVNLAVANGGQGPLLVGGEARPDRSVNRTVRFVFVRPRLVSAAPDAR